MRKKTAFDIIPNSMGIFPSRMSCIFEDVFNRMYTKKNLITALLFRYLLPILQRIHAEAVPNTKLQTNIWVIQNCGHRRSCKRNRQLRIVLTFALAKHILSCVTICRNFKEQESIAYEAVSRGERQQRL